MLVGGAQIGDCGGRIFLDESQPAALGQSFGARQGIGGFERLDEFVLGAAQVSERAQLAGDEYARARDILRVGVDLHGLAQVFECEVVLTHCGCRIAGNTQRRRFPGGVADALLHGDRGSQCLERTLQVASAEIQASQRGELQSLFEWPVLRHVHLQRVRVQFQRAIEVPESDEAEAIVVEYCRVQRRLTVAFDQRQQL